MYLPVLKEYKDITEITIRKAMSNLSFKIKTARDILNILDFI